MAEYIDRDTLRERMSDFFPPCIDESNQAYVNGLIDAYTLIRQAPASDVVERKPLTEDVEELIGMMRDYGKDCLDGHDMCANCQFSYFCESGWTPDAISDKLVELANQAAERKTGKWLVYDPDANVYECSACHEPLMLNEGTPRENNFNFCPFCGLPMKEGDDDV